MDLKLALAIGAVIAILYGLGFILIPQALLSLYGVEHGLEHSESTLLGFRYFGLSLLTIGIVSWIVRESRDWTALRGLLIGLVVGNIAGFILSLWAVMNGVMNGMGWSAVLIYLVLLGAYGYFLSLGTRQIVHA